MSLKNVFIVYYEYLLFSKKNNKKGMILKFGKIDLFQNFINVILIRYI